MRSIDTYIIKRITPESLDRSVIDIVVEAGEDLGEDFNWKNFDIINYVRFNRFMVCLRHNKITGFMMSQLFSSAFDHETSILYQDMLYVSEGKYTAYMLFKDFLDFGKLRANHIITGINNNTNIKPQTLQKYGFEKLEELYRLKV